MLCKLRVSIKRWNNLRISHFWLFFFTLQDQLAKGERINKETGELSASGELSVSLELKVEKVEGSCGNPQLSQVLREQLQALGVHACSSPDHRTDHVPLEQREEHLIKVLPLYIQVWTTGTRICSDGIYLWSSYSSVHHFQTYISSLLISILVKAFLL